MKLETWIEQQSSRMSGYKTLAQAVGGCAWQTVQKWCQAGVPAKHCLAIEAATSGQVTRYELRPDVFGSAPAHLPIRKRQAA